MQADLKRDGKRIVERLEGYEQVDVCKMRKRPVQEIQKTGCL